MDLSLEGEVPGGDDEFYHPDIIVLLTDGANSRGPLPRDAAQQAADRNIRVYTIGFGSDDPQRMVCTREQLGSDVFDDDFGGGFGRRFGGGFGDFRRFLIIDEGTLQEVADMTGGTYYRAEDADQLLDVFLNLPTQIELQKETMEISVIFVALGVVLALLAVALSMAWNRFP